MFSYTSMSDVDICSSCSYACVLHSPDPVLPFVFTRGSCVYVVLSPAPCSCLYCIQDLIIYVIHVMTLVLLERVSGEYVTVKNCFYVQCLICKQDFKMNKESNYSSYYSKGGHWNTPKCGKAVATARKKQAELKEKLEVRL